MRSVAVLLFEHIRDSKSLARLERARASCQNERFTALHGNIPAFIAGVGMLHEFGQWSQAQEQKQDERCKPTHDTGEHMKCENVSKRNSKRC